MLKQEMRSYCDSSYSHHNLANVAFCAQTRRVRMLRRSPDNGSRECGNSDGSSELIIVALAELWQFAPLAANEIADHWVKRDPDGRPGPRKRLQQVRRGSETLVVTKETTLQGAQSALRKCRTTNSI